MQKAFEAKLPKLSKAPADRRILILELGTMASFEEVCNAVNAVARQRPEFGAIDDLVFALNLFEVGAIFHIWNTRKRQWSSVAAKISGTFH